MANTTDRTVRVKFDGDAKGFNRAAKSASKTLEEWNARAKASERRLTAMGAAAASLGPALLPVLASATGLAVGLGGALAGAGAAGGVFGAVVASSLTRITDGTEAVTAAQERLAAADTTAERAAAAKELARAQKELNGPLGQAGAAYGRMRDAWEGFVKANDPTTMSILRQVFNTLAKVVPKLQPLFDVAAKAVQRFITPIKSAVNGGALDSIIDWLVRQAEPAFRNIQRIVTNVGLALGGAFQKFAPLGQSFLQWVADLTDNLNSVNVSNGLSSFMAYIQTNGPTILKALQNLATAAQNIWNALTPLAPISLAVAGALTAILAALPPEVIQALVAGFLAYKVALTVSAAAQWALNAAMTANPIGAVVLVIAALVAAFVLAYKKSETFRKIVTAAWNGIKAAASAVGRWFTGTLWPWIRGVWDKISGGVRTLVSTIKTQFAAWKSAATQVKTRIVTAFNAVITFIRGIPGKIKRGLGDLKNLLFNAGRDVIRGLINGIKNMAGSAVRAARGVVSDAVSGAKRLLGIHSPSTVFKEIGANVGQGLVLGIEAQASAVEKATGKLVTAARTPMQKAAGELLARIKGGGRVFEDFTFKGMSANLGQFHQQLADMFYGSGAANTTQNVADFLSKLAGAPATSSQPQASSNGIVGAPMVIENHIEIGGEVVRVVRTEIRANDRNTRRLVGAGYGGAR